MHWSSYWTSTTLTFAGGTTQQGISNPGGSWNALMINNLLLQVLQESMRRGAILDLALTKKGLVRNVKLKSSIGCSDHEMVEFGNLGAARRVHCKLTNLDVRRTDFGLFRNLFGRVPWDKALERRQAQGSWLTFKNHLYEAQKQCIPMKFGRYIKRPAWINK
ncbi:glycerol kinase [Willisornis vidua]|uniref:Glycerol kinase n=1 Tax=Willisornis vidua TaxID=1566151 RepID=A0ABQ9DBQ0_9PASS|nr:glycerol kinase [Willisornis vidua]